MSQVTENNSQTPPLPQVSQIWTGEKVTEEWVLHDWPSSHEQLIDFAFCGIPFGYTFDKDCEVHLYFDRHIILNCPVKAQYVSLCGAIKNMRAPTYMAGMNLSVTSKSGDKYLKDHYVYFRNTSDFNGKSIAKELFQHKLNGDLAIREKNIHLFITLEPIYFRNRPTALETLKPRWVEKVRKFVDEIEEKKKRSEFQASYADLGVPEDIIKFLQQSLQNSVESEADVEGTFCQYCTTDNMFQLYNVAKRCGFEKATENIAEYIKRNI